MHRLSLALRLISVPKFGRRQATCSSVVYTLGAWSVPDISMATSGGSISIVKPTRMQSMTAARAARCILLKSIHMTRGSCTLGYSTDCCDRDRHLFMS